MTKTEYTLLSKISSKSLFITYYTTDVFSVVKELCKVLQPWKVKGYICAIHLNDNKVQNHSHIYIKVTKKINTRNLRQFDLCINGNKVTANVKSIPGHNHISTTVIDYILKDTFNVPNALQSGQLCVHPTFSKFIADLGYTKTVDEVAIDLALNDQVSEGLQLLRDTNPNDFLLHSQLYKRALNSIAKNNADFTKHAHKLVRTKLCVQIKKALAKVEKEHSSKVFCLEIFSGTNNAEIWVQVFSLMNYDAIIYSSPPKFNNNTTQVYIINCWINSFSNINTFASNNVHTNSKHIFVYPLPFLRTKRPRGYTLYTLPANYIIEQSTLK